MLLYLLQTIDYKVGKRKRREYRKLNGVDKGETGPDEVTLWQELLHIPPVPPTGLSRCQIIDINYELHVSAVFTRLLYLVNNVISGIFTKVFSLR